MLASTRSSFNELRIRAYRRPFAGSLLARFIKNDVHQRLAGLLVLFREDVPRNFDQERVQLSFVPFAEYLREFLGARIDDSLENRVGLADQLHIAVLDAVVNHFHIMPGPIGPHMAAARLAFGHSRDLRVDWRQGLPAFL